MRRRDFMRAMVAAGVTAQTALGQQVSPGSANAPVPPPAPVPWMRGLMEVKPLPMTPLVPDAVATTDSGYFDDREYATLRRLCEIFQPAAGGYPGALEADTPEFLDFLIGVSPADRQQMYKAGLDRLEAETKSKFGQSFSALHGDQADQLIRPWLRPWVGDHPPAEPYARFINIAHYEIRTATVNSPAWNDAALAAGKPSANIDLYWYPIDPDLHRAEFAAKHSDAGHSRPM